jgi:hypothetical protein
MPLIPLPTSGVANVSPLSQTPGDFAPPQGMRNFVSNAIGKRRNLSSRPGLVKAFPQRMGRNGHHRPQALETISRASAETSFVLGSATPLVGMAAQRSGLIAGNVFTMYPGRLGVIEALAVSGSGGQAAGQLGTSISTLPLPTTANFPDSPTCQQVLVDATGTLAAAVFDWTDDGRHRTLVMFSDPRTGTPLGARVVSAASAESTDPANVAPVCVFTGNLLVIARGRTLQGVELIPVSGRQLPGAVIDSIAGEWTPSVGKVTALAGRVIDGELVIWAAFVGAGAAGVYGWPDGTIVAGEPARQYRAGVALAMLFKDASGVWGFAQTPIGREPTAGDPYRELDAGGALLEHDTIRLSEQLNRGPRGAVITAIEGHSDGSCVVTMSNSGWGPDYTFTPGGHAPTNVAKFDATGTLVWEVDTGSLIAGELGGKISGAGTRYRCDVPDEDSTNAGTTSHNGPALKAVALDQTGRVYVAGRIHDSLACVFALGAAGGTIAWRAKLDLDAAAGDAGKGCPSFSIAVDRGDQQPVVIVGRTVNWNPDPAVTTEAKANAFKLSSADGSVVWSWSTTQDTSEPSATCVAAGADRILVGAPLFTDS